MSSDSDEEMPSGKIAAQLRRKSDRQPYNTSAVIQDKDDARARVRKLLNMTTTIDGEDVTAMAYSGVLQAKDALPSRTSTSPAATHAEPEAAARSDSDAGLPPIRPGSRPLRKASKRALEEMNRETQRIGRSMQLAHEAKTRKKISKAALFERFNFYPGGAPSAVEEQKATCARQPSGRTARQPSEGDMGLHDSLAGKSRMDAQPRLRSQTPEPAARLDSDVESPSLEDAMIAARRRAAKGKAKTTTAYPGAEQGKVTATVERKMRVKLSELDVFASTDDELEIQPRRKTRIDAIFERVPAVQSRESRPMLMLRKLAHLDDPDRQMTGPARKKAKLAEVAMSTAELEHSLLRQARLQARRDRDRHLELLRSRGIHVQTAEEREAELKQVDDIVNTARRAAEEIMAREHEAAKKDGKSGDSAEEDVRDIDSEEEEDLLSDVERGHVLEDEDEEDEEDKEDDVDHMDQDGESAGTPEASESSELGPRQQTRPRRNRAVILSDDEDGDQDGDQVEQVKATPKAKASLVPESSSSTAPTVLRSASKTFIPGLPVSGPAGMSITQIFQGTMDDSPVQSPSQPMPTFAAVHDFPHTPFFLTAGENNVADSQQDEKRAAQEPDSQRLHFSFSAQSDFASMLAEDQMSATQMELMEATQDHGFGNFTPLKERFIAAPTPKHHADAADAPDSPLLRKTGNLRARVAAEAPLAEMMDGVEGGDGGDGGGTDEFGFGTVPTALSLMKEASIREKKYKARDEFDKKKSKAREMVQEQAEESEDEYAGLGGADGESDSGDDDAQSIKELIDDETQNKAGDDRKLAAYHAERERASDEKQVEKLFRHISSGMMRRKRAGSFDDLSDEDDGGEARRRMKRRQFSKMQRALLADERISKMAEKRHNVAFLRTMEDGGSHDDTFDFLFAPRPQTSGQDSDMYMSTIPDSQPLATVQSSRKRASLAAMAKANRKPTSLGHIRASISSLLDEPVDSIPATDPASNPASDSETENRPSPAPEPDHDNPHRTRPAIVDRIKLKRNASEAALKQSRLSFASPSGTAPPNFRVPALPRRGTTNSSLLSTTGSSSSSSISSTAPAVSGSGDVTTIRRTAARGSGISGLARENERRLLLAESEKKREAKKLRGARGRGDAVGALFRAGSFE